MSQKISSCGRGFSGEYRELYLRETQQNCDDENGLFSIIKLENLGKGIFCKNHPVCHFPAEQDTLVANCKTSMECLDGQHEFAVSPNNPQMLCGSRVDPVPCLSGKWLIRLTMYPNVTLLVLVCG